MIAGAGSGKTNTLAHRVAHLIVHGTDPRRILLMTFSRRAASEMTKRVERIARKVGGDNARVMTDALAWAGTFHGIGARLLREYSDRIGLDLVIAVAPAMQCRSNPVSSRGLLKTGIFQISAGDYRLFLSGTGQTQSLETDRQFAKARHWRAFMRLLRVMSPRAGLVGWSERIRTRAFLIEPGLCVSSLEFWNIGAHAATVTVPADHAPLFRLSRILNRFRGR